MLSLFAALTRAIAAWRRRWLIDPLAAVEEVDRADPEKELQIEQRNARAAMAATLVHNPLVAEVFARIEGTYIAAWRATSGDQEQERERIWTAVQIARLVHAHLGAIAAEGALREHHVRELAEGRKRRL